MAQMTDASPIVNQCESLDLVSTLITGSFGCLAYLRGLFDDDNFDDAVFALTNSTTPRDYGKPRKDYVRLKRVKRGCTQEADIFLDWLEHGALDALRKRYLQSVVLAILTKESDGAASSVCECYCFNVSYPSSDGEPIFQMHDNRGNVVNMGINKTECRKSIHKLMKKFIIITQDLPSLPQDKQLTMRLVYSDLCPPDYQPHGFRDIQLDNEIDKIYFSLNNNSHSISRISPGHVDCGYYSVSLKVLTLTESQEPLTPQRSYSRTKLDCLDELHVSQSSSNKEHDKFINVPDSQQNLATPDQSLSSLARALERNSQHSVISDTQISSYVPNTLPDSFHPHNKSPEPSTTSGIVNCICQSAQDDFGASMIQCGKCGNWVHLYCYGFRGDQDPKIKDDYKCMTCSGFHFNGDKLKKLALFRRAFMSVQDEGCPHSKHEFAERLGCDAEMATCIMASLVKKEIVKPKSSRLASFSKFSLQTKNVSDDWPGNARQYHVITNKRLQSRIMRQYFEPENNHFEE